MSRQESPCRTANSNEKPPCYRLTILGGGEVGKTAIIKRFLNDEFVEKYRETVEDLFVKTFLVNGRLIQAHIFDTAGNIQFPAMRRLSIGNAQAFLLVYDVTSAESFRLLERIMRDIKEVRTESEMRDIPIIIAGNKCDIGEDQKAVTSQMVDEFMLNETMDYHAVQMETSAKTGFNVRSIFDTFVKISPLFLNQSINGSIPASPPVNSSLNFLNSAGTLNGGQSGVVVQGGSPVHHKRREPAQRRLSLQTFNLSSSFSHHGGNGVKFGVSNYSMASNKTEETASPDQSSPSRFRSHANSCGASSKLNSIGKNAVNGNNGGDEITELRKTATAGSRRMKFFKRSKTKSHDEFEIPECYVQ